ncbi:DUF721 domain-containing protein [Maliponia aquimaris]|uniref:Zn-ribbon-containing, possibly RNA-binding protein and truncated derivatives n=1 Tax=Maliponia aquimaris TaxID=1673631 RepID=A0A238KFA9_9RHOB|nr:DciA family protein [Maliponia aquimaris]SMX40696.1 hypothetical protein MAA8898_02221 [Maliponia aquimaris]
MARRTTSTYGFSQASKLVQGRIRQAAEGRGFAQTRVLTHWDEIAGADIARIARPVEVSYSKGGFGGTLTLLTTGAMAPVVEMRREEIRARINAVYGYNAISRVRVTQTAATGFSEGQVDFQHRPKARAETAPRPEVVAKARTVAEGVGDADLRAALERLATNVISKTRRE